MKNPTHTCVRERVCGELCAYTSAACMCRRRCRRRQRNGVRSSREERREEDSCGWMCVHVRRVQGERERKKGVARLRIVAACARERDQCTRVHRPAECAAHAAPARLPRVHACMYYIPRCMYIYDVIRAAPDACESLSHSLTPSLSLYVRAAAAHRLYASSRAYTYLLRTFSPPPRARAFSFFPLQSSFFFSLLHAALAHARTCRLRFHQPRAAWSSLRKRAQLFSP